MKRLTPVLAIFLLLPAVATGCFLTPDREINLDIVYPTQQTSEVIVRYRVPPPPPGKVYVLWILNPDLGKVAKIGEVPPATRLSSIRAAVDFFAVGAIVSIESSPDVTQMSNTWALKAGQLDPTSKITPRPK
ncbi:MAG: hypothetical protein M1343_02875 [Chloroflexi bacterium]|nr:hypothetical protein [Chloroflexota bacterium]MDA8187218.1 hypothetical protein [Dehalococcoidales bacterium]